VAGGVIDQPPEPESDTVCGLFAAVSMKVNVSDFAPVLVGVNLTDVVHELPGLSCLPAVQVFDEIANWVPVVSETDEIVWVEPDAGFDRVIVTLPLECPLLTLPKLTDVGETLRFSVGVGVEVGVGVAATVGVGVAATVGVDVRVGVGVLVCFPPLFVGVGVGVCG
jgi:hypothetical protein